jgi:hypothetical protein
VRRHCLPADQRNEQPWLEVSSRRCSLPSYITTTSSSTTPSSGRSRGEQGAPAMTGSEADSNGPVRAANRTSEVVPGKYLASLSAESLSGSLEQPTLIART